MDLSAHRETGEVVTHAAKAQAAFLPSDILSDKGRIFRPPLLYWAPALARGFRHQAHAPENSRALYDVCALANNASLLFALAGDSEFAEEICARQLAWLFARMQEGGGAEAASLAIQPWINIGRLYRQRGQQDKALAQFAGVMPKGGLIAFGPFALPASDVMYEDVELIYVIDTLRTYQTFRDHERGLRFIRRLRPNARSPASIPRLDEYEFQFLLARGQTKAAARVLDRDGWDASPELMLINAFYRCILLGMAGIDCTKVLTDLAHWVQGAMEGAEAPDHGILRYALDLARFLVRLDMLPLGGPLAADGYRAAMRHEDVPLRFEFAKLATNAPVEDEGGAIPPPETILTSSHYDGLARRHGLTLAPSADAASALDDLRNALGEVI